LYIQVQNEKQQEEGIKLIEKAATFGEIKAQYHMGLIYGKGILVDKDLKKSVEWYQAAVENNDFCSGNESTKTWAQDNLKIVQQEYQLEKEFEEIESSLELLSEEDQLEMSTEIKERGNDLFLNQAYNIALKYYLLAFAYDQQNYLILSNISATFYKLNNFEDALQTATKSTEINPNFAKGYFRKGVCLESMKQYKKALVEFKRALELDPKNEEYQKRIDKINKIL
jgi:tetratricopeptide (TPR) repeat protein